MTLAVIVPNQPNYERTRSTDQSGTRKRGDNEDEPLPPDAYPPMNDDEVETSRVVKVGGIPFPHRAL